MTDHPPAKPARQRGRPKHLPDPPRVQVLTLRVPDELLRRLDAYTARVRATQPSLRVSRTEVLRMLLDEGLRRADYAQAVKPIEERRVTLAGYRLADVLRQLFD